MAELRLEELSASNIVAANNLSLKPGQEQFIAPVTYSAESSVVNPATAWQRVALLDERVVGFIHGNFDPETEQFTSFALPSNPGEVRQILGRPGQVWGAESAADKLVVVRT